MKPAALLSAVFVLTIFGCKKNDDCQLNDPAPQLLWKKPLETDLQQSVLSPFVYGTAAFFPTGLDDTRVIRTQGKDGSVLSDDHWNGPKGVERYFQNGPNFYWGIFGKFYHYDLEQQLNTLVGTVGSSQVYNEGWCRPFDGLLAGIFREKSMEDRDNVVCVFDMNTQKQLFRYDIQNDQEVTSPGDPALGRTATGDTILAFVENTTDQLLIFNLSTGDTMMVDLPETESYYLGIWNIHIRDGRVLLGLRSTVLGIDATTGAVLWQRQEGDPGQVCRLLFMGDQLLLHANTQTLYALDPATGNVVWKVVDAGFATSDYAMKDGVLYYTTRKPDASGQRILVGIELSGGCKKVYLENLFSTYAGLIGITTDGFLIFEDAQQFGAYQ